MRGHFQDIKQLVEKNMYSDSYAKHFGGQVRKGASAPTPADMQRDVISWSSIWKGSPLAVVKSFGQNSCKLCNHEWIAMIKAGHKDSKGLINQRSELHSACRHIPRFHRLSLKAPPSADERRKCEKVDLDFPPRLTRRHLDPATQLLDLDGNEFESFHSQAEMDSSEFILIL
jgi:hypothetical protein